MIASCDQQDFSLVHLLLLLPHLQPQCDSGLRFWWRASSPSVAPACLRHESRLMRGMTGSLPKLWSRPTLCSSFVLTGRWGMNPSCVRRYHQKLPALCHVPASSQRLEMSFTAVWDELNARWDVGVILAFWAGSQICDHSDPFLPALLLSAYGKKVLEGGIFVEGAASTDALLILESWILSDLERFFMRLGMKKKLSFETQNDFTLSLWLSSLKQIERGAFRKCPAARFILFIYLYFWLNVLIN